MINNNFIKNILKEYIDKKVYKYVIYPFGENGMNVKNILKNYFALDPCFIVDNEYAKYNSEIIDKRRLINVWEKDMHVILTMENSILNAKMYDELSTFIPIENIINLLEIQNRKYDGKRFWLSNFLPIIEDKTDDKILQKKIKVRIAHSVAGMWNSISTICQAFQNDSLFDVLVIVLNNWLEGRAEKQVKENGYKYIMWNEYRGEIDKPDILILNYPFDSPIDSLVNCREYAKLTIVASWAIVRYDDSLEMFMERQERGFGIYCPDYYLYDSLQYKEIKQSQYFSKKIIEMGNAKFDGIYQSIQSKKYIIGWEKLKGKTTVLWTTSHGIDDRAVSRACTFDLYAKTFFKYAYDNQEMGFIFRPSFGLIDEMLRYGLWSQNDLKQLKEYCADSPNIVYDDTDTYDISYSIADGILTDAFGGMTCSALPTLKPICAAYRSRSDLPFYPNLLSNLYSAYEGKDIIDFFEMLKSKQDPMLDLRKKASKEFVKHFDGKNGWRIKEFIKDRYFEREDFK